MKFFNKLKRDVFKINFFCDYTKLRENAELSNASL